MNTINKNTKNEHNELFRSPNLLSMFSNGSIFDMKSKFLFNSPLNMEDIINYPYFSINKKKFDSTFDNYNNEAIQIISGDKDNAFSFKMSLFTLYASIKTFKKKYKEAKYNIEHILTKYDNSLDYDQYLMIKKLELAFSLPTDSLDKFIKNSKELNEKFKEEYNEYNPLLINDFIKKEIIEKKDEANTNYETTPKIESSAKNDIIDILILNRNGDIANYIYNTIISNEKDNNLSSLLIKRNKILNEPQFKKRHSIVNQSNILLIKVLTKIYNELETTTDVESLAKDKINVVKSELFVGLIKTIDSLIDNKVHLNFKSTINAINIPSDLKQNIYNIINSKVNDTPLSYDDYINSSKLSEKYNTPNYIAINMLTNDNSKNLKFISTIRNRSKLETIAKMYKQEFLSYTGKNTSAIELYLDMNTINTDFNNSFSKSLSNGRILVGQLYGIFNQELNNKLINKVIDKIKNVELVDSYEVEEIKYMFSAQNKNPYFMDTLIENMGAISIKDKKHAEFILETSLNTSINELDVGGINSIINYLKSDALTTNIIDEKFALKMCENVSSKLNKRNLDKIDNINETISTIKNINKVIEKDDIIIDEKHIKPKLSI